MGIWSSVFAVPCEIIDKYLENSSLEQIKTLLYILRYNNNFEKLNEFSSDVNFKKNFEYWKNLGIFDNNKNNNITKNSNIVQEKRVNKYEKPDSSHVISRIKSSDEIYNLIQESQNALGRPLSSGDSAVLIMLHDTEGLPSNVILMLIQYAVSIGKSNIRYIEKTGINWALNNIDNISKAEKKIQDLTKSSILWKKFENLIGIEHRSPTSTEEEIVLRWYDNWHIDEDLIKCSYEICVNTKGKYIIKYMDGIIKKWKSQNINNLTQVKNYINNSHKNKQKFNNNSNLSYSIEEYENYSIFDK